MNYDRLIKLMMMTTSSHDGECLNAIRMANARLAEENMNWEDILKESPAQSRRQSTMREESPFEDSPQRNATKYTDPEIDMWFSLAFGSTSQYSSFYQFLTSLNQWWIQNGYLTQKQYDALRRAARRA